MGVTKSRLGRFPKDVHPRMSQTGGMGHGGLGGPKKGAYILASRQALEKPL